MRRRKNNTNRKAEFIGGGTRNFKTRKIPKRVWPTKYGDRGKPVNKDMLAENDELAKRQAEIRERQAQRDEVADEMGDFLIPDE